uniref:Hydrolase_4 domain-containing protein n=1 Tax=Strongyloides venezuelensis TaxID=75913 RepID=A0A0K0FKX8_STRVS
MSVSPSRENKSDVKIQINSKKVIDTKKFKTIRSSKSDKRSKKEIFDNLRCQITDLRSINESDIKEMQSHCCELIKLNDIGKINESQSEIYHSNSEIFNKINDAEKLDETQINIIYDKPKNDLENMAKCNVSENSIKSLTRENEKTCYFDSKKFIEIREKCKKLGNETLESKKELFYKKHAMRPLLISRKQELYLEILRELHNEKFSLPCRCPLDDKISAFYWLSKKSKVLLHTIECIVTILFDKNRGKSIYERGAFWPCPTEYFFYKTDKTIVIDENLRVKQDKTYTLPNDEVVLPLNDQELEVKISKAKENVNYEGLYLFGFNHPCYRNEDPIQFFFVQSKNNSIACAFVKHFLRSRYLIIFSHPNGTDISDNIIGFPNLFDFARFMEVNIIAYDYSGYGISNGIPNEKTSIDNLQSILEYAKNVLNYPEERIILWGYSLGGAISSLVAKNNKNIGGLILYGAPASIKAVLKTKIFKKKVIKEKYIKNTPFNTAEAVKEVKCPTLVIHSRKDTLISHVHGLKIFQNAKTPVLPLLLENSNHDYMDVAYEGWKKIREFLEYEVAFVH